MKTLFKTLTIFLILVVAACGQYQPDTMNVSISIPAPQEVIDQVDTLRAYIETRPLGSQMYILQGMPLAAAVALGGTDVQLVQGTQFSFGYELPANGYQFHVGVFALDNTGSEVVYSIGEDRYLLRCGVASGILPLIQDITDHVIYLNVTVDFQ